MKLLIVESPNKTRKIRQLLGDDYQVAASFGHVRDLPASGGLAVRFVDGRIEPQYEALERAAKTMPQLAAQAARADEILLATDPDREGEAIAWHIRALLGEDHRYRRVVFNAITKTALQRALAAPRDLDQHLIDAQQARRVLDRVVGWVVSPVLRRGVGNPAARSAGRVQSVALRLVAEREREIAAFTATEFFTLRAHLVQADTPPPFTARLEVWKGEALEHRLGDAATAQATADWCQRQVWQVHRVDRREQQRRPPPPFITATVQQAASVRLRLTPDRTMSLLQQLFEGGHITYHRTDSVAVSDEAVAMVREHIAAHFPPPYLPEQPVRHEGKAANAQEAHEAIRPTSLEAGARPAAISDSQARALYALIWQRFVASQMANGRDHLSTIQVAVAPQAFTHPRDGVMPMGLFTAKGTVVLFDGWRRVADDATQEKPTRRRGKKGDDEEDVAQALLPDVTVGQFLDLERLEVCAHSTKAPPRYTQASLIKKLEAAGIGRPSTYAAILSTIIARGYVAEQRRLLHATELGLQVVDFLVRRFAGDFIDYDYTARMEAILDRIAAGQEDWHRVITASALAVRDRAQAAGLWYDPLDDKDRPPAQRAPPPVAEGQHCPLCEGPMTARQGRFGAFFSCLDRACQGTREADGQVGRRSLQILQKSRQATAEAPAPARRPRRSAAARTASRKSSAPSDACAGPACPDCGSIMQASRDGQGRDIWSCPRFPACGGSQLRNSQ